MTKIIVYVSGGCVQDVISNREEVEVMIVDYDNEETMVSRSANLSLLDMIQTISSAL